MELNNFINIGTLTHKHLNHITTQRVIKLKEEYVKIVCDCIYEDRLDDIQTFKDFCEDDDLEQRFKWENRFKDIIRDVEDKDWF